jgi:peptide/nickel transport system substrate-binding protein
VTTLLAALTCAVFILAACAPQAASPAPRAEAPKPAEAAKPAQPAAAQPAAAPKPAAAPPPTVAVAAAASSASDTRIAKLTIAVPIDTGPLNIYSSDSAFDYLVDLVYDKLLAPSPYVDKPLPGLAESATQIDPRTWVVKLRDGVTWHDGKPFTADDVVFTYTSYRDGSPNRYTHHVNDVPKIDQIVAEDARTVTFSCNYPCPSLGTVTFADLPILPRHIWENVKEPQTYKELPIGTGPYRLVELRPDQLYRFQANEAYFLGKPLVDELVMPIIKDPSGAFTALKTGEVDMVARDVPPELRAELSKLPNIKQVQTTPLSVVEIKENFDKPPFDNARFRQALSLVIERQPIVDGVLLGYGAPATRGYTHPNSPWSKPNESTPSDPTAGKKILDELQFIDRDGDGVREMPDGTRLEFGLIVPSSEPVWVRVAELLSKQAMDAGIRLTVQPLDMGTVRRLFTSRAFDVYMAEAGAHAVADPDQFIMSHRSGNLWKTGKPYPEWDALFEQWKATTDIESRKQVSFRMQALYNTQPTSIPIYYPATTWAYRPSAYDQWDEQRGYGIVNKWSFLPAAARVGAVVTKP